MAFFFSSNLTEDVYQVLLQIFTLDYKRELKFQTLSEETHDASEDPKPVTAAESDDVLKGFLVCFLFFFSHATRNNFTFLFPFVRRRSQTFSSR